VAQGATADLGSSGGVDDAEKAVSIYPFVTVDHEGGLVNRFRPGATNLPPAASYWEAAQGGGRESAVAQINTDSFNAGTAINGLGINLNLAPVAEYLNTDNGSFLEGRSYGPDPDFTAKAAAAFIAGMEQAGILCAVKHFPGSAGADPHHFPAGLYGDRAALAQLVSPFATLIRGGHARAIMVSHSAVPAWDDVNIASLSPQVMGGWLRGELGFTGIIISDDFSMAAGSRDNANPATQAVRSLAAGADMVLVWPPDLRRTHRAILAALANGSLPRERLQEAATRIIFEKLRMNLLL
jgi:beta-N-acetylhexosaminidase